MGSDLAGALAPVVTRWYSFLPLVVVAVVVWRRHGLGRALALLAGGWVIAFAAEWSSTSGPGIPFGVYHYRPAGLTHDWLVAGVPVFDSLSFVWLAYCSYTLLGGLGARRGWRIVLAAAFMVGLDVVVDPVALRGAHWFLGSIYAYPRGAGVWYGVTLLNYLGWFVVSLVLQLLVRFCLGETRPAAIGARPRPAPPFAISWRGASRPWSGPASTWWTWRRWGGATSWPWSAAWRAAATSLETATWTLPAFWLWWRRRRTCRHRAGGSPSGPPTWPRRPARGAPGCAGLHPKSR